MHYSINAPLSDATNIEAIDAFLQENGGKKWVNGQYLCK